MSKCWVSFRFPSTKQGDARREAFVDRVHEIGTDVWDETTSYLVFDCDAMVSEIAADLKTFVNADRDVVLVGVVGTNTVLSIGMLEDATTLRKHYRVIKR